MEIGIDSFASSSAAYANDSINSADALAELLERIVHADQAGLDIFGIGEHHRKEFLDSAPTMILAAAAAQFTTGIIAGYRFKAHTTKHLYPL